MPFVNRGRPPLMAHGALSFLWADNSM